MKQSFVYSPFGADSALLVAFVFGSLFLSACERTEQADKPKNISTISRPVELEPVAAGSLSMYMVGDALRVEGEVVQQCPASGCWFKLGGESGETFVDLIPSVTRLSENHVGQSAHVTGTVVKRGSELAIEAVEVEFMPSGGDAPDAEN